MMNNGEDQRDKESRIREAAYFIWESEGRPEGEAERHWTAAEQQVDSGSDEQEPGESASPSPPAP